MQNLLAVLGVTLVSGLAGNQAAKSPTLRWGATATDSMYTDYRFLAGAAGVAAGYFDPNGNVGSIGTVVAAGSLGSLATSEMFRRQAIQTAQAATQPQPGAPAAAPGAPVWEQKGAPPFAPSMGSPVYDYAW